MTSIRNIRILVDANVSDAVESLRDLQDELRNVRHQIARTDARAERGITVNTRVESITDDLARLRAQVAGTNLSTGGIGGGGNLILGDFVNMPNFSRNFGGGGGGGGGGSSAISGPFASLRKRFKDINISMSDLHNALARAVPLLITFIGAIPVVVTTLYTLAAAAVVAAASLAAIGGLGAIGFATVGGSFEAQRLMDVARRVADAFLDAFTPLAERLEPMFTGAIRGLEMLFDRIAAEGDALVALTDEAQAFGDFVLQFVPQMLRAMAAMVESLAFVFGGMGDVLVREFTSSMRDLSVVTAEAVPAVARLVMMIGRALPAIIRISLGFLDVVNAIVMLLNVLGSLFGALGISARVLGAATAMVLTLASAVFLANSAVLTFIGSALANMVRAILTRVIPSLTAYIGQMLAAAGVTYAVRSAILALLAVTGIGLLVAGVGVLASEWFRTSNGIQDATSALQEFNSVANKTPHSDFNPYGRGGGSAGAGTYGGRGVTIEVTGDPEQDKSNSKKQRWAQGRTTGATR